MSEVLPHAHAHDGKVSLHYHGSVLHFDNLFHAGHAFEQVGQAVQEAKAQLSTAAINPPDTAALEAHAKAGKKAAETRKRNERAAARKAKAKAK